MLLLKWTVQTYHFTAVSMGNPHAIVYMDDVDGLEIEKIGPSFEYSCKFPGPCQYRICKSHRPPHGPDESLGARLR